MNIAICGACSNHEFCSRNVKTSPNKSECHFRDLNNDGHRDLVSLEGWIENLDGKGEFSSMNSFVLPEGFQGLHSQNQN